MDNVKIYQNNDVEMRWSWLTRFVRGRWQVAYRTGGMWEQRTVFGYKDRAKAERRVQRVEAALQRYEVERQERVRRVKERVMESERIERL